MTGDAGEFVVALDEGLEGEKGSLLDGFLQAVDGEVHGMEAVVGLLVTLLAQENGAVPLTHKREGETVFLRHLVGDLRPDMAGGAGDCVVGIRAGLEKIFNSGGPVQIEICGDGSGREALGDQRRKEGGTEEQRKKAAWKGSAFSRHLVHPHRLGTQLLERRARTGGEGVFIYNCFYYT